MRGDLANHSSSNSSRGGHSTTNGSRNGTFRNGQPNGQTTTAANLLDRCTEGARLSYSDLALFPPQPPAEEEHRPVIHRARRQPADAKVLPEQGAPPVYLMRDVVDVQQGYALLPGKKPINLNHHGPNWGCVMFGIVYGRVQDQQGNLAFQAPPRDRCRFVAIKQLSLEAVNDYLTVGGEENPYKEIARMQELGDNRHVIKCTEALQDDEFLYIITPKACADGTLKDLIWCSVPTKNGLDPERVHSIWLQILDILLYLESHSICHRDLSPDNFLFLECDNLVVFDLALSVRIPSAPGDQIDGSSKRSRRREVPRTPIAPHGAFGTRAYTAPEVYMNRVYDGVGSDLWSSTLVLYNLLTRQILYRTPFPTDLAFRYFVMAKALSSLPNNERAVEVLMDLYQQTGEEGQRLQCDILNCAVSHMNLDERAMLLFENVLTIDPSRRWTLEQVIASDYVRGPP